MLKFYHRILLLISTITIISFIGLGAIVHNMIYQTLTQSQTKELKKESRNYISMYNNGKQNEIKNIVNNQENLIVIKKMTKLFLQLIKIVH